MKRIIIPLAAALLLTGCSGSIFSGYRETEHLQLVQALGVDSEDAGGLRLSVSCAKPGQSASGGGSGTGSGGAIISRSGENILRAMESLQNYSADGQLYYAHAESVLFGEDFAREGLDRALDFIARDNQLRLGLYLYVVKGGSAEELVTAPPGEAYEISKTLTTVRRDTEAEGGSHVFTARETLKSLSRYGAALVCALRPTETEGSVFLTEGGTTAAPEGYAILKNGALAGFVETDISQAANLMLGHLGSSGVSLPDGSGGRLNLEFESGSVKVRASGPEALNIQAKIEASLAEPDTAEEHITDRKLLSELEKALGEDMKGKIESLLSLSKSLEADFLGLGAYLPERSESWLKNADFTVECEAKISYAREMSDSVDTNGGK